MTDDDDGGDIDDKCASDIDGSDDSDGSDDIDCSDDSDDTTDELLMAAEAFLAATDEVLSEYDQGYADADATLSIVESQLDPLREAVEEAADEG